MRNASGKIVFANRAYAAAVDAKDTEDAVGRGLELLDSRTRADSERARRVAAQLGLDVAPGSYAGESGATTFTF